LNLFRTSQALLRTDSAFRNPHSEIDYAAAPNSALRTPNSRRFRNPHSTFQLLAAALPKFAVNSVCPGWVRTDMGGSDATRSVAEGAYGIVWLAAEAPQNETGKFWRDRKVIPW